MRVRRPRRTRWEWAGDVGVVLASAMFGLATFGTVDEQLLPHSERDEVLLMLDLVVGLLVCVALIWRRRWPVAIGVAAIAANAFSATASIAGLVALYTVVVLRSRVTAGWLAAAGLAAAAVFHLYRPDPEVPYAFLLLLSVVFTVAAVACGLYVRARRDLMASLAERAVRAEAEQQRRVAEARRSERTRIAREMHDVLAHRLSLLSLSAGALEFRPDAPPAQVAQAAGVVRDSAHRALEDLRTVIGVLREGPDDESRPQPTLRGLPALVEEARRAGLRVRTVLDVPDLAAVPTDMGRHAYRIAQEGLTNAAKHAPGAVVDLAVSGSPGESLRIEISNPATVGGGAGAVVPGGGTGLVGLAERAALAGGRLEHGRTPAGGFRLVATLPWPA